MHELTCLVGHRFHSLARCEGDWIMLFDDDAILIIACLWRMIDSGRVRLTSEDDGHQFGLPIPVNAADEVNRCLTGAAINDLEVNGDLLDLVLRFNTGHTLQVIPSSAGYEAWKVIHKGRHFIAMGGGDLAMFGVESGSG